MFGKPPTFYVCGYALSNDAGLKITNTNANYKVFQYTHSAIVPSRSC